MTPAGGAPLSRADVVESVRHALPSLEDRLRVLDGVVDGEVVVARAAGARVRPAVVAEPRP